MKTPVSQPSETPVLTPMVSKALHEFQEEYVWTFDSEIDDIKDFIILYYSDEVPDKAMKVLGTLQLIQRTLRKLIPEDEN